MEDQIIAYHRSVVAKPLKTLRPWNGECLSTVTQGLGDTMMLTDLPAAAAAQGKFAQSYSPSRHFRPLMSFNPAYRDVDDKAYLINAPDLIRKYNCGNGHYLQRIRRAFGLRVNDKPHGYLKWKGIRGEKRVILHFDAGVHANWQRQNVHPRARMLYPETRIALEQFIASKPDYEFCEIGEHPINIKGTHRLTTSTTVDLVNAIAKCGWFIGIISGPMHVATALQLKCVVILNFPEPNKIFLPTLRVSGQVEEEWLYSQNVHLHQEGDGPLVKKATLDNFKRAFNGEIYPFFSDKYLSLIHEQL